VFGVWSLALGGPLLSLLLLDDVFFVSHLYLISGVISLVRLGELDHRCLVMFYIAL
jgi:hypothetical protein